MKRPGQRRLESREITGLRHSEIRLMASVPVVVNARGRIEFSARDTHPRVTNIVSADRFDAIRNQGSSKA